MTQPDDPGCQKHTYVSLLKYVDERFNATNRAVAAAEAAAQRLHEASGVISRDMLTKAEYNRAPQGVHGRASEVNKKFWLGVGVATTVLGLAFVVLLLSSPRCDCIKAILK